MLNEKPAIMLGIALILAIAVVLLTGCTTSLESTCDRFGMDTSLVKVRAVNSETLGETKVITEFNCKPRLYKVK